MLHKTFFILMLSLLTCALGCRYVGNAVLPPHPRSGWDKGTEMKMELVNDKAAERLVLESQHPKLAARLMDRRPKSPLMAAGTEVAATAVFKALGLGIKTEAKRYSVQQNAVGAIQGMLDGACTTLMNFSENAASPCPCRPAIAPVPDPECDAESPLFLAIQRRAPTKFYPGQDEEARSLDFLYLVQAIREPNASAVRFVPVLLIVNRTQAKVAAIHWSRPWSLVLPWMWIYEAVGRMGLDWHKVKGTLTLNLEAPSTVAPPSIENLGSVRYDLKKWRVDRMPESYPNRKDLLVPSHIPYVAWVQNGDFAFNVYTESKEENSFGKALTGLGDLLGDEAKSIAEGAADVLGVDDTKKEETPATPTTAP
jgi:hypothetical protein